MSPGISSKASRQLGDLLGDASRSCGSGRVLLDRAVDLERDRALGEVADLATGWIGPIGAERSKLLPISQGFFSSPIAALQVAPGHVEADV